MWHSEASSQELAPEPNASGGIDSIEGRPETQPPAQRTLLRRLLAWLRRRWLLVLVILLFVVFVALQFNTILEFGRTLIRGRVEWLLAAVLLQGVYYLVYAALYYVAFQTVEVESDALELVPVLFASIFLKVVVPSGGVSAVAVFVDDAARRGESAARAAEGALLVLVADLATMLPLILFGFGSLASQGVLAAYQIIVALLFVLFVAGVSGVLLLGRLRPDRLRAVLQQAQQTVNNLAARFNRPPLLPGDWAERNAVECIGAACDIAAHPRPLWRTLFVALLVHVINTASLYAVALAYSEVLAVGTVVAAYSMDIIFSVINIIPHGIGVAEGVMSLVFVSLGVPTGRAVVIAVVFRGLNVWLPLVIGFFLLGRVPSLSGAVRQSSEQGESGSEG